MQLYCTVRPMAEPFERGTCKISNLLYLDQESSAGIASAEYGKAYALSFTECIAVLGKDKST